jgi:hypothetical protein
VLDPVVEVAMRHLSDAVNHNNALVQGYDKAYAVRTLQELVCGGHRYEVDALCAWALANGFTQSEVEHLRDYATRALEGRSFRLRESVGPRPGACARWEQEAHGGDMWPRRNSAALSTRAHVGHGSLQVTSIYTHRTSEADRTAAQYLGWLIDQ